jgi:hypothetical protein
MSAPAPPPKDKDFLDTDPPLRGQNYAVLSLLDPHDVVLRKEAWFFQRFLEAGITGELRQLLGLLKARYPKDTADIASLEDRHAYLFDPIALEGQYNHYVTANAKELEDEYLEKNDYQTSMRGIKIRGVFDTLREAQIRAEVLKRKDPVHNLYLCQVGVWCPWLSAASSEQVDDSQYQISQLNTMMRNYKDNIARKNEYFELRKRSIGGEAGSKPSERSPGESEPGAGALA